MPDYIKYDPSSAPVAGVITGRWKSWPAERLAELGANVVLVPDLSAVPPAAKYVSGAITALTQAERDSIAAAQALAEKNAIKATAKAIFVTPEDATAQAIKLAFETLIELTVSQLNTLRTNAGLATITNAQVKTSFKTTYESKIDVL